MTDPSSQQCLGYFHPRYAESLAEFGAPLHLPQCDGWLLERPIADAPLSDAMGCYPLFCCRRWDALASDLETLGERLVSVTLVADPFADLDDHARRAAFPHLVRPFKRHFIADLSRPPESIPTAHHRYYAKRALRQMHVERIDEPIDHLDEWTALYQTLIDRHHVGGMRAFSARAFEIQLQIPGMTMLRATLDGQPAGATLWLRQGDVVFSHLSAYSELGYRQRAAYALWWRAICEFAGECRWLDFGGAAGAADEESDGLTVFKRGWSTESRMAYLCGRITHRAEYERLASRVRPARGDYFPAYRAGEFG